MIGRRFSALALLLSCAYAPVHAQIASLHEDCWQGSEVQAAKLQRFKTMLLVSMLNCRDQQPGMNLDYNRFIRANRDLIAAKQAVVRQHFIRIRGPAGGLAAYSNYETALGNHFSDVDFSPARCADAAAEMRLAGYVSERGLMDIVQSVPDDDDLAPCPPDTWFADRRNAWSPPPMARAPEPQAAQNEWPDLAPVEPEGQARAVDPNAVRVADAPPPPAVMPEKVSEPVQVAAVDVAKPAAATAPAIAPDRVKAVHDAAKALREALAALEAEDGAGPK